MATKRNVIGNKGAHDFRRTVVEIWFDGFERVDLRPVTHVKTQADYLERGLTQPLLSVGHSDPCAHWLQQSHPVAHTLLCLLILG